MTTPINHQHLYGTSTITSIEQHYELVRYYTTHPDTLFDFNDYMGWAERNTTVDWASTRDKNPKKVWADRIATQALNHIFPVITGHRANTLRLEEFDWWKEAVYNGVLYRTGRGIWIYDTKAKLRPHGKRAELVDNQIDHVPATEVRKLIWTPRPVAKPELPKDEVSIPLPDVTPPTAPAPIVEQPVAPPTSEFTILALDAKVGGQVVIQTSTGLIMAQVNNVIPTLARP